MHEHDLEKELGALKESWRAPADPPLDEMWVRIEARAFAPGSVTRIPARWSRTLLPLAAMLVLGFGIGQLSPSLLRRPGGSLDSVRTALAAQEESRPFVGVATDYLEQVTALLVTVVGTRQGQSVEYSSTQARDLLSTTRLLMDTPKPLDPRLRSLLEDLELVLAQIARLPARPDAPDVYLIDQALDQRDVIPRLRVFLAETPTSTP